MVAAADRVFELLHKSRTPSMRLQAPRIRDARLQILLLSFLAGCGPAGPDSSKGGQPPTGVDLSATPLRIAAASDLQRVLPKLMERFSTGRKIILGATYDASGRLTEQIKAGAPFDVFLSANRKFVEELAKTGAILPDTV